MIHPSLPEIRSIISETKGKEQGMCGGWIEGTSLLVDFVSGGP